MTIDVGRIEQSNGTQLPRCGLGSWLAKDPEEFKTALRAALDVGYRKFHCYIDTAAAYGNEEVIGDVLQDFYDAGKLKREDLWITSKLSYFAHEQKAAEEVLARSLKALRTSYLDLYLIHAPIPMKPKEDLSGPETDENDKQIPLDIPLSETWRFFEGKYEEGVFRSIGISNFNACQIEELCEQAKISPHNLQVELHILWPQHELLKLCIEKGISVTSYSTLGSPGRKNSSVPFHEGDCLGHPVVQQLAKKYNKTPAQILLRHTIQQGISVVPKSTHANRVRENIDIFDFEISAEDQRKLFDIHERARLLQLDFAAHHPQYPFRDTCALGVRAT